MTLRIAVLGTGLMGAPMAANLLAAGHRVTVWNRTRAKTEPLTARGAAGADSPAAAVGEAEVVVTMLENGPAVTEVLFDSGAAEGGGGGSTRRRKMPSARGGSGSAWSDRNAASRCAGRVARAPGASGISRPSPRRRATCATRTAAGFA
ncbi:MAG: NAD(P)-binding domain-containing protein [Proteobacteria bacterium]|nr:NAD(P)-binding domain-containing protein [Pseudomonadota bacterium]